jgi:hypothetical protein
MMKILPLKAYLAEKEVFGDDKGMEDFFRLSVSLKRRLLNNQNSLREQEQLFFRLVGPIMQNRLFRYIDLTQTPQVFVHGNPHLDNYVRTFRGSALLDFDRSRVGPYCWDLIRFMSSLAFRKEERKGFLDKKIIEALIDGYLTHFIHPDIPFKQIGFLKKIEPEKWQQNTREYLKANKKWAKKMRLFLVPTRSSEIKNLVQSFLASRYEEHLLNQFYIDEAGQTPGTMGKKHYIISLAPKNSDSLNDYILLDIKEVYHERNTKFFKNPYPHQGLRMIEASKLFADGVEQRLGFTSLGQRQYWGRQVPTFAVKVKKILDDSEMIDAAYSVASQLGKGHRKYLKSMGQVQLIEKDFLKHFDTYFKIAKLFTFDARIAFETMLRREQLFKNFKLW